MKKNRMIMVLLCLVLGVSVSACKKDTASKKDGEAVSDEQGKEQEGVSVIIKDNEEEKEESNQTDGTDTWGDIEIEISDSSDTVQTETPSEQPKQDTPELPDYYPGAY